MESQERASRKRKPVTTVDLRSTDDEDDSDFELGLLDDELSSDEDESAENESEDDDEGEERNISKEIHLNFIEPPLFTITVKAHYSAPGRPMCYFEILAKLMSIAHLFGVDSWTANALEMT